MVDLTEFQQQINGLVKKRPSTIIQPISIGPEQLKLIVDAIVELQKTAHHKERKKR